MFEGTANGERTGVGKHAVAGAGGGGRCRDPPHWPQACARRRRGPPHWPQSLHKQTHTSEGVLRHGVVVPPQHVAHVPEHSLERREDLFQLPLLASRVVHVGVLWKLGRVEGRAMGVLEGVSLSRARVRTRTCTHARICSRIHTRTRRRTHPPARPHARGTPARMHARCTPHTHAHSSQAHTPAAPA
jgi:hypothetical protein